MNQTRKTFLSGSDLTEADRDGEYNLSVCLCVRQSVSPPLNQTRKTFLSGSDLTEADRDGEYNLSVCLCVRLSFNQTRKAFLSGSDLTEADRDGEYVSLSVCLSAHLIIRLGRRSYQDPT